MSTMYPEDSVAGGGQILDKDTANTLLQLATPETARAAAFLVTQLEATTDRDRQLEYMRTVSKLLLLDVSNQDLQAVIATASRVLEEAFPALPEGDERENCGRLLVFLNRLAETTLGDAIDRVTRLQEAARLSEAVGRFGSPLTH